MQYAFYQVCIKTHINIYCFVWLLIRRLLSRHILEIKVPTEIYVILFL